MSLVAGSLIDVGGFAVRSYSLIMSKPLKCLVGLHVWHQVRDDEDSAVMLACYRCDKRIPSPSDPSSPVTLWGGTTHV